jgi:hypothetical protein
VHPGYCPGASSSAMRPASWNWPRSTILKLLNMAPSSHRCLECGGMDPGEMPPMSAWCPRLATKKTGLAMPLQNTGVMMVKSGKCDPPIRYFHWYRGVRSVGPVRFSGLFCSGLRGRRRIYHTILKLADHALFKMVRNVLQDPATSEAEEKPARTTYRSN